MTNRYTQIGYCMELRLEWLEYTANLLLAGTDGGGISKALDALLADKISVGSDSARSQRDKTITLLTKIWVNVPAELQSLRNSALEMMAQVPNEKHMSLHLGMCMAAYPFIKAVAEHTGRLLALQGSARSSQIQRRIQETYGQRETVQRATRRVITTFMNWGILERESGGVYRPGDVQPIDCLPLTLWLIEAILHTIPEGKAPMGTIIDSPALFPFRLDWVSPVQIAQSGRIEVVRHGLDEVLLILNRTDEELGGSTSSPRSKSSS